MPKELNEFGDRRKFARVNIHAIVRYFLPDEENPTVIQTRISDISEGGVLMVICMKKLHEDTLVEMSFVMPGKKGHLAIIRGKVRHTRVLEKDLYESGVEFLNLERQDQLVIRECVASHPKK